MEGYRVVTAQNGREALAKMQRITPDLVITDWMMPSMDGSNLCRQLRQRPETMDVPIIAISFLRLEPREASSLYDLALQKPVKLDALLRVIEGVLALRGRLS